MKGRGVLYSIVMGALLLSLLLTALSQFVTSFNIANAPQMDEETKTFIQQQKEAVAPLENDIENAYNSLKNLSLDNPLAYIIGAGTIIGVLTSLLASIPAVLNTVVFGIAVYFGVPEWVVSSMLLLITAMLVFAVINWLYGRRGV